VPYAIALLAFRAGVRLLRLKSQSLRGNVFATVVVHRSMRLSAGSGKEMRLAGKVALVTGAASGFGAEIARTFAREGASVAILDIDAAGAHAVATSVGPEMLAIAGDVTSAADVGACVEQTIATHGRIDIVVNNAGWTHRNRPMLEVTEAEFDKVYAVNVKSIYLMTQAVVPAMRRRGGGVIINVGSTAGIRPRPGLTWYNGSKAAVNLLSRSMAAELAPDRIRVNCVAPVIGETGLLESFMGMPDTPENRARFIATIPLGRMSRPRDIANACLFLASDEAEFITGVVLEVDGGRTV
jgi:3-oxoacyl-[acyl-carrier protein] reductase